MQGNTKKRGAILSAVAVSGILVVYLFVLLAATVGESLGSVAAVIAIVLAVGILGVTIVGIFAALKQRLREIEEGEEDAAKKY